METGLNQYLRDAFSLPEQDLNTYSPLTLAFLGDAVYSLIIRTVIVGRGNTSPQKLHKRTADLVKAKAQAQLVDRIAPLLTEEEETIYRRGRNAHPATMAKHASMTEYRKATGLEALVGYLYLTEQTDRMTELIRTGLEENPV